MEQKTIYIFGDSIMKGVMPDENMNYHSSEAIGFDELAAKYNVKIVNYSMPTFTSSQVSMWAKRTMEKAPAPDYVIFEFGGNDCDLRWKEIGDGTCPKNETHRVPIETFEANYRDLMDFFAAMGAEPIMAFSPKIHVKRYLEHLFESGVLAKQAEEYGITIESVYNGFGEYKKVYDKIAEEYGCKSIDLNDNFPEVSDKNVYAELDDLFSADGMHPSEKGYGLFHKSFDKAFGQILK